MDGQDRDNSEAGPTMSNNIAFSYERLLTGEDWVRWDPFPDLTHSEHINVPTNMPDESYNIVEETQFPEAVPRETSPEIGAPEFLRWLMTTSLAPQLPDLPLEDETMIEPSDDTVYEWIDRPHQRDDVSQDMHMLDVDNISYEMGKTCTGEGLQSILTNLERQIYNSSQAEEEQCVICLIGAQEEFAEEVDVATMRCGHEFHLECIKRWLALKNSCPLCKRVAWDYV